MSVLSWLLLFFVSGVTSNPLDAVIVWRACDGVQNGIRVLNLSDTPQSYFLSNYSWANELSVSATQQGGTTDGPVGFALYIPSQGPQIYYSHNEGGSPFFLYQNSGNQCFVWPGVKFEEIYRLVINSTANTFSSVDKSFQFTSVNTRPRCYQGLVYVRSANCVSGFSQATVPSFISNLSSDYGRCTPSFNDLDYCGPYYNGWTDNLIQNGLGQVAWNSYWDFPPANANNMGVWTNAGTGKGFTTTSNINQFATRSQVIDLLALGLTTAFLNTNPQLMFVVRLTATIEVAQSVDKYGYTIKLLSSSNVSDYYGNPYSNRVPVNTSTITVNISTLGGSLRYIFIQEESANDLGNVGPSIQSTGIYLNLNECLDNNGGCDPQRACIDNLTPPASCGACNSSYDLVNNTVCVKKDPCNASNPCPNLAVCTSGPLPDRVKNCTCPIGYSLVSNNCMDIDECTAGNRVNGNCTSGTCFNVIGANSSIPICLPVATPCSLAFGTNSRSCNVTLPDNGAGHNMTFLLTGSTSLTLAGAYFGPATDRYRFNCNSTALVSGSTSRCIPPAGVFGANLGFTFIFCSSLVGKCFDVDFRSAGVFNHPVPVITASTIRFYPAGTGSTHIDAINNAGDDIVAFSGSYFIDPQFLSLPFTVRYRNGANNYSCPLQATSTQTSIVCQIAAGQGLNFHFEILWDNQLVSVGTDTFSYPVTPIVTAVWGCLNNANAATSNCPTSDLPTPTIITIQGSSFGTQGYVAVAGINCRNVTYINSTLLTCTLPQGVGLQLPVTVSSGIFVSLPAFALSYALPTITSVSGCSGSSLTPNITTTGCARDGSSTLTITGSNFGSQIPVVTVGGFKCTNVVMVTPHLKVSCKMPRVVDVNTFDVVIQQFDGQESQPPYPSVSYVQCLTGSSNAYVACTPCPAGTYSANDGDNCINCVDGSAPDRIGGGATSCLVCNVGTAAVAGQTKCNLCGPGKYADQQGLGTCETCPAGSYSTGVQNSACTSCNPGQAQALPGQITCGSCSKGRYADFYGLSDCYQCQPGKYSDQIGTGEEGCTPCPLGYAQTSPGQLLCVKCEVGKQAAQLGQSTCAACLSGRYAASEASSTCTMCDAGFFQSNPGQTYCSPCVFGTQAPESGSSICDNCVEGSFGVFSNDSGTPACTPCNAGYSQPAPSQSSCSICPAGRFSAIGASTCTQCQAGYYASASAASECRQCPIGAKPDFMFASCLCPVGTFSQPQKNDTTVVCASCPNGAVCTTAGVTEQGLLTEAGWWRAPNTLNFYRCRFPELCLGGLGDVCGFAREGPLCAICINHYSSNGPGKPCTLCPEKNAAWGETVGIMLLVLAAILVLMVIMLKYSNMQQRALIALTKANDVKALQQMQATLKEYEVGDDYFEKIREMNRAQGQTDELEETDQVEDIPTTDGEGARVVLPPVRPHAAHEDFQELSWAQNFRVAYKSAMEKAKVVGMLDAFVLESTKQLKNKLRRAPNFIYKVKILLGFFQVATIMPLNGIVNWPLYWSRFISAFSFFNFDFIPWSSLSCATSISYLDKALIIGCVPIAAVILIAIVVFLWDKSTYRYGVETQMEIQMHQRQVWRQFTKLVLFTVFLLYPFSSKVTLGVYNCVTVEDQTYVAADFTLNCSDPYYIRTAGINAIFVLLYPIGVPCACFYLLYKNLHRLREPETVLQFGFLYDAYADDRWYWEIVDMTHKLCLTSITLFLPSNAVMQTNMCIIVAYFIGLVLANPYIRKGDDRFHLLVQVNLYLLALIGLILITIDHPYRTDVADEETMIILLSCLLIFMNVGLFIGFFIIAGRNALKIIRGNQRTKRAVVDLPEPELLPHPSPPSSSPVANE